MKYTIEEIKSMLLEPSFYGIDEEVVPDIIEIIEKAIAHHERLSNDDDAENQ